MRTSSIYRSVYGAAIVAVCAGCVIAVRSSISYLPQDGTECMAKWRARADQCAVRVGEIAYVILSVRPYNDDDTAVNIALVPRSGRTVRWASKSLEIVDLDKGATERKDVLGIQSLTGLERPSEQEDADLFSGNRLWNEFVLAKPIPRAELRLPDILSSGEVVPAPRFQYEDGDRTKIPVPAFLTGH